MPSAGTASQIVFSGTQLIASIKGIPPTPGFLAVWDVGTGGSLSETYTSIAPPTGGILPFSMTPIQGKNAFLVTDPALGFDIFDLSASTTTNDTKSSAVGIPNQGAVCWSSFSNKTGSYYLTDVGTSIVTEVSVDDNLKGSIVKVSRVVLDTTTRLIK